MLTTEAELRAWYIAINPTFRSMGLYCPRKLYMEMQRDLRDFDATVGIIQLMDEGDHAKHKVDEFFALGEAKPNQYTCRLRQLCPGAPIYVVTSTSDRESS